jgi:hypothetical protein
MKEKVHILFIVIPCDKKDFIHKTANLHISKIIFVRHGGSITKKQNGQKKIKSWASVPTLEDCTFRIDKKPAFSF